MSEEYFYLISTLDAHTVDLEDFKVISDFRQSKISIFCSENSYKLDH